MFSKVDDSQKQNKENDITKKDKFWNIKRIIIYAKNNAYIRGFIISMLIYTGFIVSAIIMDYSSFFHLGNITKFLMVDSIALGSCSIAAILAFMTILSIGITIQNNEYYGIYISDIYACRNPKKSFGFGFEIATLLYISALIFVEMIYKCVLLIEITMLIAFVYCFLLWYFESRIVVRDDEYIYKSLKKAHDRFKNGEQENYDENKMDTYFSEFIYSNDIEKLIKEDNGKENLEFLLSTIFKGLEKNSGDVSYQNKMLKQLETLIEYCKNNDNLYISIVANNCIVFIELTRFSLNEQNQYDVDIRLISLLLRYAGDEQYKFTAISFLKIARYAIENAIKPLLSAILDNMSIYRKDMNRIKTLYFGVFIYLYELINNTNYSSYIGKQEKELVISLLKTKSLDYGNSYSNMIEYFLGTYRFDDDALYSMQFFVKDYYSFSDDKHPEYSFFDREVLLNIFFSKMIFLDEKLAYLSIFKNDNDTYGYYANYCYTFFNDLLNKSISTNVTEPLSQMLEFYGNYSFLYFVTEDDEKLERIKKSMFDIVNELLKDRNERFSDSEKYESLLCDNLQKVTNAINEIFDAEFSGVKNCKPKGKVQKESIMLPILDFPLTYNGVEGIARNIYNYHIMEYLKRFIRSKKKNEDIISILKNDKISSFYTNLTDFSLKQLLGESDYIKLKRNRIFFDSYLLKPFYIIKNSNFFVKISNLAISTTDYSDNEIEIILERLKQGNGYFIIGALYDKNDAIDVLKKNYRKLIISFDFEYYLNGLHLCNNLNL